MTDIAAKIQHQDEVNTIQGLSSELYATALDMASQLRALAARTPDLWWVRSGKVRPDDIVQFMHHVRDIICAQISPLSDVSRGVLLSRYVFRVTTYETLSQRPNLFQSRQY